METNDNSDAHDDVIACGSNSESRTIDETDGSSEEDTPIEPGNGVDDGGNESDSHGDYASDEEDYPNSPDIDLEEGDTDAKLTATFIGIHGEQGALKKKLKRVPTPVRQRAM